MTHAQTVDAELDRIRVGISKLIHETLSVTQRHSDDKRLNSFLNKLGEAQRMLVGQDDSVEAAQVDWVRFRSVLKLRRMGAQMSQKELAAAVGVSTSYVRAWENGQRKPTTRLLMRLLSIPELTLNIEDLAERATGALRSLWLAREYQPTELLADLCSKLAGSGCALEQTFAYLDTQSARDYLAICNHPSFVVTAYENTTPLDDLAKHIANGVNADWLDVIVLGCGDAKQECELTRSLVKHAVGRFKIKLILIDISHALLTEGYKHACASLDQVKIVALQGNFHDIAQYGFFPDGRSSRRARLFTMLGDTLGSLDNEHRFFRDSLAGAGTGNYFLIDYCSAFASPEHPDEIRRLDPAVGVIRESHSIFLKGNFHRYCKGMRAVDLFIELNTDCIVKGSYELAYVANVQLVESRPNKRFVVFRIRRYDGELLAANLSRMGWSAVKRLSFGELGPNRKHLMLLQRKPEELRPTYRPSARDPLSDS